MAVPEHTEADDFEQRSREFAERLNALRRINEQINRLRSELSELNERAAAERRRRGSR